MKSLEPFLTRLLPLVPTCPDPTARQALVDSAIEFCERTDVLQVRTDPIQVVAGEAMYDIDLPPYTEPARLLRAWVGTQELVVMRAPTWAPQYDSSPGGPTHISLLGEDGVALTPLPAPGPHDMLTLLVAHRPVREARQLDDKLLSRWADAVVHGALSRLAVIPGQAFTDPGRAAYGHSMFMRACGMACVESRRLTNAGELHVRARPFA